MTNDSNDILYREFFIQTTRDKLQEMTEDLIRDERVKDFGKMESDLCKTDTKSLIGWMEWMCRYIDEHSDVSDTVAHNRKRLMKVLISKIQRKTLNKQ